MQDVFRGGGRTYVVLNNLNNFLYVAEREIHSMLRFLLTGSLPVSKPMSWIGCDH